MTFWEVLPACWGDAPQPAAAGRPAVQPLSSAPPPLLHLPRLPSAGPIPATCSNSFDCDLRVPVSANCWAPVRGAEPASLVSVSRNGAPGRALVLVVAWVGDCSDGVAGERWSLQRQLAAVAAAGVAAPCRLHCPRCRPNSRCLARRSSFRRRLVFCGRQRAVPCAVLPATWLKQPRHGQVGLGLGACR